MITTVPIGRPVEVNTPYLKDTDRFVVSLCAGYSALDGIDSPEQAAAAALALICGSNSDTTMWSVLDKQTGLTSYMEQSEFEEIMHARGFIR